MVSKGCVEVSRTYDKAFFEAQLRWKSEYRAIADILAANLNFRTVLDLGCGNGFLLTRFHELGKCVRGVDGSRHALAAIPRKVRGFVVRHDLTTPLALGAFDLVVCSEVAEHLENRFAHALVRTVCMHSTDWIYFSAACPGQGGHHHVNEQPHSYWVQKFARFGFSLAKTRTFQLRHALDTRVRRMWWVPQNSMLFRAA